MRTVVVAMGLGLAAAGCGEPGLVPIDTARVSGLATLGGRPLEGYRVFFYCADARANEPASGRVDADGRFELAVRNPGDGAIVGRNAVWLTYDPDTPGGTDLEQLAKRPRPKVALPKKYQDAATSGLIVEVPPGGLSDYRLDLK